MTQALAIERWNSRYRQEVLAWLARDFPNEWEIVRDYDLEDLIMSDSAYFIYVLKFADERR